MNALESTSNPAQPPPAARALDLRPLMFQIFACSMGMMAFVAVAGPVARMTGLEPWHMGVAMTLAGVAWMVMARRWGAMSDQVGRRPVLLIGFGGFVASFLLLAAIVGLALGGYIASFIAFLGIAFARGAAGFFYAAVPAASAALVADHTEPAHRARTMAGIGAASASGLVVGPGLAGLLASINLSLPLYALAVLPMLGLALVWRTLPRQAVTSKPHGKPLGMFDPRLRRAVTMAFVAMFSVTIAQITIGFLALDRLGHDPARAAETAGIALALVGVALVVAQTILRRLDWAPIRLIRVGAVIGGLGFGSVIFADTAYMLWASYALAAFGMGWIYPSVSALCANAVEATEQGAAAGTIAAAQGLGTLVGPIVGTAIYGLADAAPFALIGCLLILAGLWPTKR